MVLAQCRITCKLRTGTEANNKTNQPAYAVLYGEIKIIK